jgi:hypothetical protein
MQIHKEIDGSYKDTLFYGLGLDGIIYYFDQVQNHWVPITNKRVHPLYKQPKRLKSQLEEREGGKEA